MFQQFSDDIPVLIVRRPVRSRHACVFCFVVDIGAGFYQALNDVKPGLVRILGLTLDEESAEAHAHQWREKILVLLIDQLFLPPR